MLKWDERWVLLSVSYLGLTDYWISRPFYLSLLPSLSLSLLPSLSLCRDTYLNRTASSTKKKHSQNASNPFWKPLLFLSVCCWISNWILFCSWPRANFYHYFTTAVATVTTAVEITKTKTLNAFTRCNLRQTSWPDFAKTKQNKTLPLAKLVNNTKMHDLCVPLFQVIVTRRQAKRWNKLDATTEKIHKWRRRKHRCCSNFFRCFTIFVMPTR